MRRHLIFDLDGTLVDSCAICCAILGTMLADRGSTRMLDPVAARPWMSIGGARMVAALLAGDCGDAEADIVEFRRRYALLDTSPDTLFPGVASGLQALHAAGFTLSICSNKPQNLIDKVLTDTALAPLFTSVVGQRAGLPAKPAPDMLDHVLAELNATPDRCLFIGDSEIDHQVADSRDVPFLFVTYGYAHADYVAPENSYACFGALTEALLAGAHA